MHEPEALHLLNGTDASRLLRGLLVLGALVVVMIAAVGGYAIGRGGPTTAELTGRAEIGDRSAQIRADGTTYRIADNVAWIDEGGSIHDDGWPECFDRPGTTVRDVTFGVATIAVPDVGDVTSVVYIDCRSVD